MKKISKILLATVASLTASEQAQENALHEEYPDLSLKEIVDLYKATRPESDELSEFLEAAAEVEENLDQETLNEFIELYSSLSESEQENPTIQVILSQLILKSVAQKNTKTILSKLQEIRNSGLTISYKGLVLALEREGASAFTIINVAKKLRVDINPKILNIIEETAKQGLEKTVENLSGLPEADKENSLLTSYLEEQVAKESSQDSKKMLGLLHLLNKADIYLDADNVLDKLSAADQIEDLLEDVQEIADLAKRDMPEAEQRAEELIGELAVAIPQKREDAAAQQIVLEKAKEILGSKGIDLSKLIVNLTPEYQKAIQNFGQRLEALAQQGKIAQIESQLSLFADQVANFKRIGYSADNITGYSNAVSSALAPLSKAIENVPPVDASAAIGAAADLVRLGIELKAPEVQQNSTNSLIELVNNRLTDSKSVQDLVVPAVALQQVAGASSELQNLQEKVQAQISQQLVNQLSDPHNSKEVVSQVRALTRQGIFLDNDQLAQDLESVQLAVPEILDVVDDTGLAVVNYKEFNSLMSAPAAQIDPKVKSLIERLAELSSQNPYAFLPVCEGNLAVSSVLAETGHQAQAAELKSATMLSIQDLLKLHPELSKTINEILEATRSKVYSLIFKIEKAGPVLDEQTVKSILSDLKKLSNEDKKNTILIGFLNNYVKRYGQDSPQKILQAIHMLNKVGVYLNPDDILPEAEEGKLSASEKIQEITEEAEAGENLAEVEREAQDVVSQALVPSKSQAQVSRQDLEDMFATLQRSGIDIKKLNIRFNQAQEAQIKSFVLNLMQDIKAGNQAQVDASLNIIKESIQNSRALPAPVKEELAQAYSSVLSENLKIAEGASINLAHLEDLQSLAEVAIDLGSSDLQDSVSVALTRSIDQIASQPAIVSSPQAAEHLVEAVESAHELDKENPNAAQAVEAVAGVISRLPESTQVSHLMHRLEVINEDAAQAGEVGGVVSGVKTGVRDLIDAFEQGVALNQSQQEAAVNAVERFEDLSEREDLQRKLRAELNQAQLRIDDLVEQLEQARNDQSISEQRRREAEAIIAELPQKVISEVGVQAAQEIEKVDQAIQDVKSYVESGTQAEKESADIGLQTLEYVEELRPSEVEESLKAKLDKAQEEIAALRISLEKQVADAATATEVRERSEQMSQALPEVSDSETQVEDKQAQEEIASLSKTVSSQSELIESLQSQLSSLRHNLEIEEEAKVNKLLQKINSLESESRSYKKQVQDLKSSQVKPEVRDQQIQALEEKVKTFESSIQADLVSEFRPVLQDIGAQAAEEIKEYVDQGVSAVAGQASSATQSEITDKLEASVQAAIQSQEVLDLIDKNRTLEDTQKELRSIMQASQAQVAEAAAEIATLRSELKSSYLNAQEIARKVAEEARRAELAEQARIEAERYIAQKAGEDQAKLEDIIAASQAKDEQIGTLRSNLEAIQQQLEAALQKPDISDTEKQSVSRAIKEISTQVSFDVAEQIERIDAGVQAAQEALRGRDPNLEAELDDLISEIGSVVSVDGLSAAQLADVDEQLEDARNIAQEVQTDMPAVASSLSQTVEILKKDITSQAQVKRPRHRQNSRLQRKLNRLVKQIQAFNSNSASAASNLLSLLQTYENLKAKKVAGLQVASNGLRKILSNGKLARKVTKQIVTNNRASFGCNSSSLKQAALDFKTLVDLGLDINQPWGPGRSSALIYAAQVGCAGVVKALLQAGADRNQTNSLGATALQMAKAKLQFAKMRNNTQQINQLNNIIKLLS